MNTDNTSLVNKLILLVHSLILVCLVLILVQVYTDRKRERAQAAAAAEAGPDLAAGEVADPGVETNPVPPRRRTLTNQVRSASRIAPSARANAGQPGVQPPSDSLNSGTVTFQGVTGFGLAPGVVAEEGAISGTNGAEIFGVATLLGMPKPEVPIDLGSSCGRLNRKPVTTRHYVVNSAGQLANVFVYISKGLTGPFPALAKPVLLDQVGCMFEPYIFALQTGQTLRVKNSDPEFHNMHVIPRLNPERNFAQLKGQVTSFTFKQPELFIRFKCDVHPWMLAYACVSDHPFFSVTDTNGAFRFPTGLPAGNYTLTATHLKAGTLAQEFEYRPGESKAFAFQFVVPDTTQALNR